MSVERGVKLLIAVLTILISTNLLSVEKASREDLIEAFDGKYISIEMRKSLVCFKVDGNKIKVVNHESKCADVEDISIRKKGAICIEFPSKEKCNRIRVLTNGDFAMGKRLRPIYIFDSKKEMLGSLSKVDDNNVSKLAKKQYKKGSKLYKRKKYWEAVELFKKSAELGHSKAQSRYAYALEKGKGVDKNRETSIEWYKKSAAQDNTSAQARLGWMLMKDGDYKPALEWLKKAANGGNFGAQNNVGYMYKKGMATGWGNQDEAIKWYTMAAEGGNKVGQYNVCLILYRRGAHKYTEAKVWCERSAGQGYRHARDLLKKMDNW